MIDTTELVICNKDLRVKSPTASYLVIDKPKGDPFYAFAYHKSLLAGKEDTLEVRGFAGYAIYIPASCFKQYFATEEREAAYGAWIENSNSNIHKESFISGFIAKANHLKSLEQGEGQ